MRFVLSNVRRWTCSSSLLNSTTGPEDLLDSLFQTLLDDVSSPHNFLASKSDQVLTTTQPPQSFIHQTHLVVLDRTSNTNHNGFSSSTNSSTSGGALLRQSSSPADFFSSLFHNNDAVSFASCRGNSQAPYHSTQKPMMPSMPEFQQHGVGGSLVGLFEKVDSYTDCWQDSAALVSQRTNGDLGNETMFSVSNEFGHQNGYAASNGLIHQMSLPNTPSELGKYLKFQDSSTPCSNTRAKRGFATHPRSIAERVRRTRISDRIRKLQQLFPDIDKQTNTAQMLDMATDYIKYLQKEVQSLTDTREKCKCLKK